MTSTTHPYDPATVAGDRRPSDSHPRHYRAAIVATYHGPTDRRGAVWRASIKRSPNERAITATVPSHDGPDAAVSALITKAELTWRMLPSAGSVDGGNTYTYVAELTPGEGQALAAGERAVWGLAAAAELEAITAGAEPADPSDPMALALLMARVATGTDRPRPIVAGWQWPANRIILTDIVGRPIDGLTFHGDIAPGNALAAAQAAGWLLTAPMRAGACLLSYPAPAAVAQALEARGGCPAVIATLKGAH